MSTRDGGPIVYVTSDVLGYVFRFLPIGRLLAERGHRIVVVSHSTRTCEYGRTQGFDVVHLPRYDAAIEALPPSQWPGPIAAIANRIPGLQLGPRGKAKKHWAGRAAALTDTAELTDTLSELAPALVLTEAEEHRTIRATLATGLPLMVFEDLYSTRPGRDVPMPARSHQIPTGTLASRLQARARWERFFAVEALRRKIDRWWVDGNDWHSALARIGEPHYTRRFFQYYDYVDVPSLRTIAPELAFPGEELRPTVTGPIVDLDRRIDDIDPRFDDHWARAKEGRVVYVSLGTFLSGLRDLTADVIAAASTIPDVEVVVAVGKDIGRWDDVETAANVGVFSRVPQTDVLADAEICVVTGGLNTGHESLWFGVPVLNLPVGGLETRGNAARLVYHRVGRRLTPKETTVETLRAEMMRLLEDDGYRTRAAEMGKKLRAHDGINRAADAIEAHLG